MRLPTAGFRHRFVSAFVTVSWMLVAAALAPARGEPAAEPTHGLTTLLRDQIALAGRIVGRSAGSLSDDTRLAIAASGLTSNPVAGGVTLIVRTKRAVGYAEASERRRGFSAAVEGDDERAAVAFALSLVLSPGSDDTRAWREACQYLARYDQDFDRLLVGVIGAPESLPLLAPLQYAASDAMVCHATPKLISLYTALAQSDDVYLRSRALIAIGVVCYRTGAGGGDAGLVSLRRPRESSISATQQHIIDELFLQAANDGSYRVRAAAALAMGLRADDADLPVLERLARDRAYVSVAAGSRNTRQIDFPVRAQAVRSIARFGRMAESAPSGTFSGRELRTVLRGGQDVTNDRRGLKRDRASLVRCHEGDW